MLTAYNVKTKQKGCPVYDAVITRTAKGAFMVQGKSIEGQKMTALLSRDKVNEALTKEWATLAPGVKLD